MVARIGLKTNITAVQLGPGESSTVEVTITNLGQVVDAFNLGINSLDPSWYTIAPQQVSLFPQASGTATLQIRLPAGAAAPAGSYSFELVATSRDKPTDSTAVSMLVQVTAGGELSLDLEPQRIVARRGTFTLLVKNEANAERPLVLKPTDPDAILVFTFGQPHASPIQAQKSAETATSTSPNPGETPVERPDVAVGRPVGASTLVTSTLQTDWTGPGAETGQGQLELTVPANTLVEMSLNVETKRRIWTGREAQLKFDVAATPPGVEYEESQVKRVSGELIYTPILAAWSALPLMLRRILAIALPLLLLALLLFLLLRPQPKPQSAAASNATPTVAAQVSPTAGGGGSGSAGGGAGGGSGSGGAGSGSGSGQGTGSGSRGPLKIVKFDFASAPDGNVQVTWEVTNALTVTLNATPVALSGTQPVDINSDQSLTLSATNGKDVVSQSKGVLLLRPPEIKSFTADPPQTCPGCEVTLKWSTTRSNSVTVDGTPVPGPDGSMKVKPTGTTDYLLSAQSNFGEVESSLTVTVTQGLPTPTP